MTSESHKSLLGICCPWSLLHLDLLYHYHNLSYQEVKDIAKAMASQPILRLTNITTIKYYYL